MKKNCALILIGLLVLFSDTILIKSYRQTIIESVRPRKLVPGTFFGRIAWPNDEKESIKSSLIEIFNKF